MQRISLMIFIAGIASILMAQQGQVYDNLTMTSSILKTEKRYAIYLPPGYETSQLSYPVLYLLHGGGGNQTTWIQKLEYDKYYVDHLTFYLDLKILIRTIAIVVSKTKVYRE